MTYESCKCCPRKFKYKDLYNQHIVTCEFMHTRIKETEREAEAYEELPSQQNMYKLIQHLALQCSKLQEEVGRLKTSSNIRKKKMISDWLTGPSNLTPTITFLDWASKLQVTQTYLDKVYRENLTEGMKKCIESYLDQTDVLPFRAFSQKPNILYVYMDNNMDNKEDKKEDNNQDNKQDSTESKVWKVLSTEDLIRWVNRIALRFLQEFTEIQSRQFDIIFSNNDERDKNIRFMIKINDGKTSEERRALEIKRWLIPKIAHDLKTASQYEF